MPAFYRTLILSGLSAGEHVAMWQSILARRDHGLTVVVEDAEAGVVGFGNAGPCAYGSPAQGSRWTGEIYTLYLLVDWHGQGIGRAMLLSALFDRLKRRGWTACPAVGRRGQPDPLLL